MNLAWKECTMGARPEILTARAEAERFQPFAKEPRPGTSPRLSAAMDCLAAYIRRQPDVTLGELRAAFLGTGFIWSPEGKLAFSPSRMALIAEFDELIEAHGWDARGAELFL
jgi:hypothetical protein